MNYFKKIMLANLLFFSMLPISIAQLTVKGQLYLQDDALVHVQNDIAIRTADGVIENNGKIGIEGNLEKAAVATFNNNPTGQGSRIVVMAGTTTQRIDGDFTGSQGFYNLKVDKPEGLVELNNDIEVSNILNIDNGKIRTDINSGNQTIDYQHEVFVSNPAGNAIVGNTSVLSDGSNYIEGNLRRSVTGMGLYIFPVGLDENESVAIKFTSPAVSSEVTASFENGQVSQTDAQVNCTGSEVSVIDCVIGKWNIQGNGANDNYNIIFYPGTSLVKRTK